MDTDSYFVTQKPLNAFLSTLVDYYFYIDALVSQLSLNQEYIIPFPRITFGYFFGHPFLVTNHTLNQSISVGMGISRISAHKITVQPQSDRVRIIGAHLQPFCLAYLTKQPLHTMPALINPSDVFGESTTDFKHKVDMCSEPEPMFTGLEKLFLDHLLVRDLSLITNAIQLIDERAGDIQIKQLAKELGVSDRTIRLHFDSHIGCSPKEYIRLVKLKQVAYQMKYSPNSLTTIAHDNNYFDQAHFIHEVKDITGKSPNELKKGIPGFRFLQF